MIKMNKKGDGQIMGIIVTLTIGLLVILVVGSGIIPKFFKSGGVVEQQFGGFDDYDGDKVANFNDACPCTPIGTIESSDLQGCPRSTTAQQSQEDKKNFNAKTCPEQAPMTGEQEIGTTSFELFDGTTKISAGPTYSTRAVFISPKISCATECNIKIILPDGQEQTQGITENIDISTLGRYFIILTEKNQEKIRYQIQKTE